MIKGLFGRPFLSLEPFLDLSGLDALDEEICTGLSQVPTVYTGGCHRSMGIMPPSRAAEGFGDYGEALQRMSAGDFAEFLSLDEETEDLDPAATARDRFGEEKEHPLSFAQMKLLEIKHGVYFPWKVFYQLIETEYWDEKSEPREFTREARVWFPRTVAFLRSLPFVQVGRCNILGLESNHHGTVHRDGDPARQAAPDQFITFVPRGDKRLFLWDEEARRSLPLQGRAYWFNDFDYHGVEADPWFRYSLRIDGVFEPSFLARLQDAARAIG